MTKKPTKITSTEDLKNYYWLKSELIALCKEYSLSTQGAKLDLIKRLAMYLSTGMNESHTPTKKLGNKDSDGLINPNTLVKNYKNDAITREFFIKEIGGKFKFNAYLRQFTNPKNIQENMTYGDLVEGWIAFEKNKSINEKSIDPQFQYNQFIKDYFFHEKGATLEMAIKAWKKLISGKGPHTYDQYIKLYKK